MKVRPAAPRDAAAISSLCNAISRAFNGEPDADDVEVLRWLALQGVAMFVAEEGGRIVGYCDVQSAADATRFPADLRVAPGDAAAAEPLLEAAEDWAKSRAAAGALVRVFAPEDHSELQEALARRGLRPVRHSFQMAIDLDGDLPPPEWPAGVAARWYQSDRDELPAYECVQEAFEDHWDSHRRSFEEWRRFELENPRFDPELWWLAWDACELAGVCLNGWHYSGDPRYGHVGLLAVRRPWRRRGLGLALLRHSFADFAARGANRIGLEVDGENLTGAVRLYERAGMHVVRRTDIYEKGLTT